MLCLNVMCNLGRMCGFVFRLQTHLVGSIYGSVLYNAWRSDKTPSKALPPRALLVGMQTGAATVENSMECPQTIKNKTILWPNNSTSGNISK